MSAAHAPGGPSENAWRAPACPYRITWDPDVLDDIRVLACDAFYAVPRVGLEIGGILLGRHDAGEIHVTAFRPLECEHASGPAFVLSAADERKLQELIAGTPPGLEAVGWYHTHTRSEIFLSEADLAIYRRFFPEPWQVALVVRPAGVHPTRAGFFFRDAAGRVHAQESLHEFVLVPARRAAAPAPPAAALQLQRVLPSFDLPPPRRRAVLPWLAVALVMGAAGWAAVTRDYWMPAGPDLSLSASDVDGQMSIRWDPRAPAIRRASGGAILISDGTATFVAPLGPGELRSGEFHHTRTSERVRVRLLVTWDGRRTEGVTGLTGAVRPSTAELEARRQRDEAVREAAALRLRVQRLERRLRWLE